MNFDFEIAGADCILDYNYLSWVYDVDIEDPTHVVISYEIYETSLWRVS